MKGMLAIDPGASGGVALLHPNGTILLFPMPKTEGDIRDLVLDLTRFCEVAWIEEVGGFVAGRPAPGSAMFNFGRNVGFLHGLLAGAKIPLRTVRPQEWQKALGCGNAKTHGTRWKQHLKGIAQQLHPSLSVTLKTADALLILEHARRIKKEER